MYEISYSSVGGSDNDFNIFVDGEYWGQRSTMSWNPGMYYVAFSPDSLHDHPEFGESTDTRTIGVWVDISAWDITIQQLVFMSRNVEPAF